MSKLIGRKEIQININDLKNERIPIYDYSRGLWTTVDKYVLLSSGSPQLDQVSGSTFANRDYTFPQNLTVGGSLTAEKLLVSSSVIYESGSTAFGDSPEDTHQFTGSVLIDGSVKGKEFQLNAGTVSVIFTGSINQGIFGVSEYIYPYISTTQYSGMTVEYLAQRPSACRMGIIMASWLNTGSVVFTDISTMDVGDTSDISFTFITGSNELRLRVNSGGTGSGTWTVQSLFKLFPNLTP